MFIGAPTSKLGDELVDDVIEIIDGLVGQGMTIVFVAHRARVAQNVVDRVILLDDGLWIEIASPDELFNKPKQERTRQSLAKI